MNKNDLMIFKMRRYAIYDVFHPIFVFKKSEAN